jgi:hypothetical protein
MLSKKGRKERKKEKENLRWRDKHGGAHLSAHTQEAEVGGSQV